MRTYNSYQDLLTETTGEFGKLILSASPAELDKAASTSIKKNNMAVTVKPTVFNERTKNDSSGLIEGVHALMSAMERWNTLADTDPEEALMQLSDDNSEICQAINADASFKADVIKDKLSTELISFLNA